MSLCRNALLAAVFVGASLSSAVATEDDAAKNCILNAFAKKLELTPDQQTQVAKIHADGEQKLAPICERIWALHWNHHQAVLQILSAEQRAELTKVMNAERTKIMSQVATKLALTDEQKKSMEKVCNEYAPRFMQLDPKDPKLSEKFQALKKDHFEAFCGILNDDQRVKLPALIQGELAGGRTPSSKSDIRNAMVDALGLSVDQKARLDKVCDEYGAKIEEEKKQIRDLCKEKQAAVEKVLTEDQKSKFREYVKASEEK